MQSIDWYDEGRKTGRTFDWAFPEGINPWDHFVIWDESDPGKIPLAARRAIQDFEAGFQDAYPRRDYCAAS
jgi:hypothetical protein